MKSSSVAFLVLVVTVAVAPVMACGSDADAEPGNTTPGGDGLDGGGDRSSEDGRPPPVRSEFGLDARPSNTTCKAPPRPPATAPVAFQQVFGNLGTPMVLAQRPGDGARWYVARRNGILAYFPTTMPPANANAMTVAVNLGSVSGGPGGIVTNGEGGFLGFAFHPSFAQNGRAYVSFTAPAQSGGSMSSVIAELTSTNGGDTFTGYKQILRFEQTSATNHKGGGLAFDKTGRLLASFGDGGPGNDGSVNGQSTSGYFSKVLRIDVDAAGQPETFARGFRNPFRISVDRESGDLWVGDVGQNQWEEIDLVEQGGNYGWPCREGKHDYLTTPPKCPSTKGLLDPVVEHQHPAGGARSITGGVVYRGKAIPAFVGTYVYGDYVQQELWGLSFDPGTGAAQTRRLNEDGPSANWVSFAEDVDGEVYAVALNGSVYKLVAASGGTPSTFPDLLSKTGCKDTAGLVPFGVNAQLWSDGADKERFIALPDGATIAVEDDGDFEFPNGTVLVKSFTIGGKYVETRLFVRHDDGGWAGYSYEWNDEQTDAVLLPSNKSKSVGAQTWYYPSRSDCVRCHTSAAGRSLGPEIGQLNGDFVYGTTNRVANQLRTLEHIGMFAAPLGKPPSELAVIPRPDDAAATLDARARAYLHANCSNCHRPEGGGGGTLDLRFTTGLKETMTCNGDAERGDLGVAGAKLLVPGTPAKSLVSLRPRAVDSNRMPPLGTSIVDEAGLEIVDDWIRSVVACP